MARVLICTTSRQEGLNLYQAFRERGHAPKIERSPLLATRACMDGSYDLVLLDAVDSHYSVLGACRRLRATSRTRSLPVMVLVGRDELLGGEGGERVIDRFLEAGASDYAPKPLDFLALLDQAEQLLTLTPSLDWAVESLLLG